MALVFNGFELGAIFLAIIIANQVTQEGESTWFEGLQLLAVYARPRRGLLLRLSPRLAPAQSSRPTSWSSASSSSSWSSPSSVIDSAPPGW